MLIKYGGFMQRGKDAKRERKGKDKCLTKMHWDKAYKLLFTCLLYPRLSIMRCKNT